MLVVLYGSMRHVLTARDCPARALGFCLPWWLDYDVIAESLARWIMTSLDAKESLTGQTCKTWVAAASPIMKVEGFDSAIAGIQACAADAKWAPYSEVYSWIDDIGGYENARPYFAHNICGLAETCNQLRALVNPAVCQTIWDNPAALFDSKGSGSGAESGDSGGSEEPGLCATLDMACADADLVRGWFAYFIAIGMDLTIVARARFVG